MIDQNLLSTTESMWKYNPVPEFPEPFPEFSSGAFSVRFFNVTAASVRGKKHKHDGTNNDDYYCVSAPDFCGGKIVIAALCDGAGSRRFSRIGAKAASVTACEALSASFCALTDENPAFFSDLDLPTDNPEWAQLAGKIAAVMRNSVNTAFYAVKDAYEKRLNTDGFEEATLSDFASTFLASVIIKTAAGFDFTAAISIGDGEIAAITETGEPVIFGNSDKGNYAGETDFLLNDNLRTEAELKSRTRFSRKHFKAYFLMSDGVADDYFPTVTGLPLLLCDLKLNGIVPFETPDGTVIPPPPDGHPEPLKYKWVNDPDVSLPLLYCEQFLDSQKLCTDEIYAASCSVSNITGETFNDKAERLYLWLDNYSRRGSFDDRTLVVIRPNVIETDNAGV
ncbi:MAG: protein phosphatase 2C domain-containing protein [Ruminococcus sp.]|nr:protein phosphatase 2C domain-containing protein [Ruminococcus sp.]